MNIGYMLLAIVWLVILVFIYPMIGESINLATYVSNNPIITISVIILFLFPLAMVIHGAFGAGSEKTPANAYAIGQPIQTYQGRPTDFVNPGIQDRRF